MENKYLDCMDAQARFLLACGLYAKLADYLRPLYPTAANYYDGRG